MRIDKRHFCSLIISLIFITFYAAPVWAKNQVQSIDIQAILYEDGSMGITQIWEGYFDEGTEAYIPLIAPDYLRLSDLRVADGKKVYQVVEPWNVEAGLEEKAYKCGINYTAEGYGICFGLSEYGHNRYAIEYRLEQAIGSYSDLDGVNFRFVNSGMNTTPTDVKVEIRLADGNPLTDEISDIWAFGFEGQISFEDGAILAFSEKPLSADNLVTVLMSFDKGLLNPVRTENASFELIKAEALSGSDYDRVSSEEASFWEILLSLVFSIGLPLLLIVYLPKRGKKKAAKQLQKFAEKQGYFRELPNGGNRRSGF